MKSMVLPSHSSEKTKLAISLSLKMDIMFSILRKIWIDIKPIFVTFIAVKQVNRLKALLFALSSLLSVSMGTLVNQ